MKSISLLVLPSSEHLLNKQRVLQQHIFELCVVLEHLVAQRRRSGKFCKFGLRQNYCSPWLSRRTENRRRTRSIVLL